MSVHYANVEDAPGLQTLEMFSATTSFNKWMFDSIEPYCTGNILEIGSGIGNLSELLIKNFGSVTLSDYKETYCEMLRKKFASADSLKGITRLDLADINLETNNPDLIHKFDTVIALNVVEHIEDEELVLKNIKALLKEKGRFIMLVPAFGSLYNTLDKELGHYRRYTKKHLRDLFTRNGWQIAKMKYFNAPGIAGWWLFGNLLKRKLITQQPLSIYNRLVPLFRIADRVSDRFFGLSLIAIATVNKTRKK